MARSVKKHMSNCKVVVCLMEEKAPKTAKSLKNYFDHIFFAKDIGIPQFYRCTFQYRQAGGTNACKAQLLIYLLGAFKDHNYFVFLDSDTKVFGPFSELTEHLETSEVILSPHFISFNVKYPLQHLSVIHRSGIFNTGFLAIKRGKESGKFLHWWAKLLLHYCYKDPKKGLWNEQKWLDLAPGLFQFHVQLDPGYNVGPWNFQERHLTVGENGDCLVNGKPLRLFHFSGLSSSYFADNMTKAEQNQQLIISKLRREYLHELKKADQGSLSALPWSYDFFTKGNPIDNKSRVIFRDNPRLFCHIDNPFQKSNHYFTSALEEQEKKKQRPKKPKG